MGTPTQCDMLCDTFVVSIMWKVKLGRLASETVGLALWSLRFLISHSLSLTSMYCDDAYPVMPRDSALAGCDRLASEPLVIEKSASLDIGKASKVENATVEILCGLDQLMERREDGGVYFIWVSLIGDVRTIIMNKTHASRYLVHPGADKTYYDLRVDRLTKSAHFLAIREDYKMEKLARLYIDEIVAGHGVPVSIISDRDGRYTSRFLANITKSLKDAIRYEYDLSSLDGWTNYHSSIRCALFEALYGRKYRSPVLWAKIRESRLIGPELVQEIMISAFGKKDMLASRYLADANLHVHLEEIKVNKTLHFVKEPIEIIDREVKSLKHSRILTVKVHYNSKRGHEDFIKTKYPHLLVKQAVVGSIK
ncbi:putative reverse transcriptase domain-containing protein [Tanacetum coccineum]